MTSGALTSMTLKSSIHMCQTHYTQEGVLQAAPAQCADARADLVHGGYLRHARALDARHHAGVRDPYARPILRRLRALAASLRVTRAVATHSLAAENIEAGRTAAEDRLCRGRASGQPAAQ